jgi:transposase
MINPNDTERADSRDIRHFATRKNPRYYKSYAVTPSEDDQSAVSGIIRN